MQNIYKGLISRFLSRKGCAPTRAVDVVRRRPRRRKTRYDLVPASRSLHRAPFLSRNYEIASLKDPLRAPFSLFSFPSASLPVVSRHPSPTLRPSSCPLFHLFFFFSRRHREIGNALSHPSLSITFPLSLDI